MLEQREQLGKHVILRPRAVHTSGIQQLINGALQQHQSYLKLARLDLRRERRRENEGAVGMVVRSEKRGMQKSNQTKERYDAKRAS